MDKTVDEKNLNSKKEKDLDSSYHPHYFEL